MELAPGRGGAEQYAYGVTCALRARGDDVSVLAARLDPSLTRLLGEQRVHRVDLPRPTSAVKNLAFAAAVATHLARAEYDIVYGLSPFGPQDVARIGDGLHGEWLRIQTPFPPARWLKMVTPRHRAMLALERAMLRPGNQRHVVANSHLCRRQAIAAHGLDPGSVSVIPGGVDGARFNADARSRYREATRARLRLGHTDVALLFAGHNFRRKGLYELIEALGAVPRPARERAALFVAGRDKKGDAYRLLDRAARFGFAGRTHFLGAMERMEALYAAADLFVLPSWYDPCSLACMEALACGLPVVTTATNGAGELVPEGVAGHAIPTHHDIDLLADRLATLIADDNRRAALSRGALAAGAPLAMEHHVESLAALFARVATDSRNPLTLPR
ncbi:MAG: glycosyltransferase family 4 protein [Planctomycetes bacterium]|nr:glycosyltransferase family 4 protein [Planctomycetota bacterium]